MTSATAVLEKTTPIIFAGLKKGGSSKTLYFPGGYVYSDNEQSVIRYLITLKYPSQAGDVTSVELTVNYTDLSGGSPGVPKTLSAIPCQHRFNISHIPRTTISPIAYQKIAA